MERVKQITSRKVIMNNLAAFLLYYKLNIGHVPASSSAAIIQNQLRLLKTFPNVPKK
jgi:hypothetical protein